MFHSEAGLTFQQIDGGINKGVNENKGVSTKLNLSTTRKHKK